ncbi:MAG: ribonuclease E activity regulator RraA, partial [Gammaproteobacteria bacterium]|nr:ribonuclease E activity regulator RraA [Gammaproteobacteria bacterium]
MKTADLCDSFPDRVAVARPVLRDFGGARSFHGAIATVQCFEDNSLVRKTLESDGRGRVLVVDGGGSMRRALLGDQLAELAIRHHWSGVVINGCIRDSAVIGTLPLGVKALGTHPLKSEKKDRGKVNLPVYFAEIEFTPGAWLYADEDGVVVAAEVLE